MDKKNKKIVALGLIGVAAAAGFFLWYRNRKSSIPTVVDLTARTWKVGGNTYAGDKLNIQLSPEGQVINIGDGYAGYLQDATTIVTTSRNGVPEAALTWQVLSGFGRI